MGMFSNDNSKVYIRHISSLGYRVVDNVTGFKGVITSISFELYGCIQAIVTSDTGSSDDGSCKSTSKWFDVSRLTIVDEIMINVPIPNFDRGYIANGLKGASHDKPGRGN